LLHFLGFIGVLKGELVPARPPAQPRLVHIDRKLHYVYAMDDAMVKRGDCIFQLASERRASV
jgi:hypothetical protein